MKLTRRAFIERLAIAAGAAALLPGDLIPMKGDAPAVATPRMMQFSTRITFSREAYDDTIRGELWGDPDFMCIMQPGCDPIKVPLKALRKVDEDFARDLVTCEAEFEIDLDATS